MVLTFLKNSSCNFYSRSKNNIVVYFSLKKGYRCRGTPTANRKQKKSSKGARKRLGESVWV